MPPTLLFHISDDPGISRFEPRYNARLDESLVWAIDDVHLHTYFVPRQCPRVTFYARPDSAPEDVERLMGGTSAKFVVALESRWMPELLAARLYRYDLSPEPFEMLDAGAGYYVSREPVTPLSMTPIPDLLAALLARDVELRVMPSLWKLREQVIASTLQFSIHRMRNAAPPPEGYEAYFPLP